jgi:glutamyl-tRNA synthetase
MLLGWFPGEGKEVISLEEAVKIFKLENMSDVQVTFDIQKLRWLNGEYIMASSTEKLLPLIKEQLASAGLDTSGINEEYLSKVIDLYKVRMKTLSEFVPLTECFFKDDYEVDEKGKKKHLDKADNRENLKVFAAKLESLENFSHEKIESVCRGIAEERSLKAAQIIHPTRMAISGKMKGAGLFEMMEVLGKRKVLERMRKAIG